jgi:outer membrane murein-binding lipoprotein Lpp
VVIPVAGADAVRSTGSLLVRALAVGGLTAAAWLLSGAVASASPADDVSTALDSLRSTVEQRHESVEDLRADVLAIRGQWTAALRQAPVDLDLRTPARQPEDDADSDHGSLLPNDEDDESYEDPSPVYSGGMNSSTERSGSFSNTMPEELYVAKVAAKQAAKAAAAAAVEALSVPEPVAAAAPVTSVVIPSWIIPAHQAAPVTEDVDIQSYSDLDWERPGPASPAPTPQPASAPTAPTASSSNHDNSGGARGALAVMTAQSALHQPSVWTVERRDDGRTPGSVQGLPSSSPD